jgi:hypothetical protein
VDDAAPVDHRQVVGRHADEGGQPPMINPG